MDITDYLGSKHSAPLVMPGQAVQEFWNNLQAIESVSAALRKQFDLFKAQLGKVNQDFGNYMNQIDVLLDQFRAEYGYVYDEAVTRKTLSLLEVLTKRASVAYATRGPFQEIGMVRKRTKTPPGFRDEGDGDFYIWVDLLTGLLAAQVKGETYKRVAFVTVDRKIDWSREGTAHPILTAEVQALLNVPFEIWTLDKLASEIAAAD